MFIEEVTHELRSKGGDRTGSKQTELPRQRPGVMKESPESGGCFHVAGLRFSAKRNRDREASAEVGSI